LSSARAQSTHAVCGYCQSTVVRQGEVLSRIGKMAELFDDHSPLQLFATGSSQKRQGAPFTLIGRLQYKTAEGTWTEWNALLTMAATGWLAEDNGAYVFTQPDAPSATCPRRTVFAWANHRHQRQAVQRGQQCLRPLISAQGELPKLPALGQPFDVVELRSASGEVLSIDYTGTPPPSGSAGHARCCWTTWQLKGLKDESAKEEKGRQFNCPHCGAPVTVAAWPPAKASPAAVATASST
jgi:hypothetical protein